MLRLRAVGTLLRVLVVVLALIWTPVAHAAKTVKGAVFPFGWDRMVGEYITDTGVTKKWGAKYGVDLKVSYPRDDFAAFMGRSVQIVTLSSIEIARLVGDEGHDIVVWGKDTTAVTDIYVRTDSPYQSPVDVKGKKIVIPGWDTGAAQIGAVILKDWYGIDLKNDYKVVSAPWPIVPTILAKGDAEMALNQVPLTMVLLMEKKIRPIVSTYATEYAKRTGTGHLPSIANFSSWGKFFNNNPGAVRAWLGAWNDGLKNAHTNTKAWASKYRNYIKKDLTEEQLNFFVNWFKKKQAMYADPYLSQEFIDNEMGFLRKAVKAGFVKPAGLKRDVWKIVRP